MCRCCCCQHSMLSVWPSVSDMTSCNCVCAYVCVCDVSWWSWHLMRKCRRPMWTRCARHCCSCAILRLWCTRLRSHTAKCCFSPSMLRPRRRLLRSSMTFAADCWWFVVIINGGSGCRQWQPWQWQTHSSRLLALSEGRQPFVAVLHLSDEPDNR